MFTAWAQEHLQLDLPLGLEAGSTCALRPAIMRGIYPTKALSSLILFGLRSGGPTKPQTSVVRSAWDLFDNCWGLFLP